ncbi:MAG: phytanoyl-CoA dioxygenase [Alphaproteobacteria bacterium]|nr:MAG: phytanoyl-CoA dioxygenase [Alphaproteobacteria bacterium]
MIDNDLITAYRRDGVVLLRQAFDADWIGRLSAGIERNIAHPGPRSRLWDRDEQGRCCFYDSQVWREIPEYQDFVLNSPCAALAGRLMGSRAVNFFFDAIFVRTPGAQFRTPWHQDEPYWSVKGFDTCSVWMPLVPVERRSALEFVRGSHLWDRKFRQTNFGALTGDARDQVVFDEGEPFPDIEGHRDDYDIVAWDMEPGDAAFFNARIIHGGSGNLAPGRGLKVFNTQWLGDDVRVCFRPEGMDPDHSQIMTEHGLKPGDRPAAPLYPMVWQAETSGAGAPAG